MTTTPTAAEWTPVVNRRVWRHLSYTVWGGVPLFYVGALSIFPFSPSALLGVLGMTAVTSLCAFIAAWIRVPWMRRLFARVCATPSRTKRWALMLLGTGLLFELTVLLAFALLAGPTLLSGSADADLLGAMLAIPFGISLPWLLAALVAAVYVNYDWLKLAATL